jgi:biopolymer transport protein ExbD
MPSSLFQIERFEEAAVVTMTADGTDRLYLGTRSISLKELDPLLDEQLHSGRRENSAIVIRADRLVPSDALRQVAEICMRKGLRVVLAGAGTGKPSESTAE